MADQTYNQASDKVSQMMDRGREAYDRARASVNNMASTGTTGSAPGGNSQPGSTGNIGSTSGPYGNA